MKLISSPHLNWCIIRNFPENENAPLLHGPHSLTSIINLHCLRFYHTYNKLANKFTSLLLNSATDTTFILGKLIETITKHLIHSTSTVHTTEQQHY